jgi:hypothetical protein
MGVKKERKHINLVGKHTIGRKGAKAGARAKSLSRQKSSLPVVRPGRPGGGK